MNNYFKEYLYKGLGLGVGFVISISLTSILAVSVTGTINYFSSGEQLDSSKMNQNFSSLKTAIETIPNWTKSGTNNDKAVFQSGYVGIGVSNPSYPLEISSFGNITPLLIRTSGTTNFSGPRIYGESPNAETSIVFDRSDYNNQKWWIGVVPSDQGGYFAIYNRSFRILNVTLSNKVGILTDSPSQTFTVNGTAGNSTGVWVNNSDIRLKKDIRPLESFIDKIRKLEPVRFKWKDHKKLNAQSGEHIGFVAQEMEKIYPDWVHTDEKGMKWLNLEGFNAVLVRTIQEIDNRLLILEKKEMNLKNKNISSITP